MKILLGSFVFIFGLIYGSFLNVVIYRLKNKKSILGRSYCPYCKKTLKVIDLIPIFSYLSTLGKCRYCKKPISIQYPLVEFLTGILFLIIFWHFSNLQVSLSYLAPLVIYYSFIASILIIIFTYDARNFIIPDKVIFAGLKVSFLVWLFATGSWIANYKLIMNLLYQSSFSLIPTIWSAPLGVLIGGGFFLILVLISKGKWMGGGDVKLGTFMGLILGYPLILVALFLAFTSGALVGTVLILTGRKSRKDQIPFGPFLTAATFFSLIWGPTIIKWYLNLLNV